MYEYTVCDNAQIPCVKIERRTNDGDLEAVFIPYYAALEGPERVAYKAERIVAILNETP